MMTLRNILRSPYFLWFLLTLPVLGWMDAALTSDNPRMIHILVHPTGEWAARLTIFTLMITPLCMLFRGWKGPRWMMRNRRYFGVAAFAYAVFHLAFYVVDKGSFDRILTELPRTYIWTGWVAMLLFIPLAATSMDYAMRNMGRAWKRVQQLVYLAAIFIFVHWAALHNWGDLPKALVHFVPLIGLTIYRLYVLNSNRRKRSSVSNPA